MFSIFRGANIKLHQVVTKTLKKLKSQPSIRIKDVIDGNASKTVSEVKSYKTLEHTNFMFEKKNNPIYLK